MPKLFYGAVVLGAAGLSAYLISLTLSEQFSPTGTFNLVQRTINHLENHPRLVNQLKPPLYSTNTPNNYQPWINENGQQVNRVNFVARDANEKLILVDSLWIDGKELAKLHLHFLEGNSFLDLTMPVKSSSSRFSRFFLK